MTLKEFEWIIAALRRAKITDFPNATMAVATAARTPQRRKDSP